LCHPIARGGAAAAAGAGAGAPPFPLPLPLRLLLLCPIRAIMSIYCSTTATAVVACTG